MVLGLLPNPEARVPAAQTPASANDHPKYPRAPPRSFFLLAQAGARRATGTD